MAQSTDICPVCGSFAKLVAQGDRVNVECSRCGSFAISQSAITQWQAQGITDRQRTNASGWIREHQAVYIRAADLDALATRTPPSVVERADNILKAIDNRSPSLGQHVKIDTSTSKEIAFWLGISWSADFNEVDYLVDRCLLGSGLLAPHGGGGGYRNVSLTPAGYARLQTLSSGAHDSTIGFCAMWFDPALNSVWLEAIEPAILDAGYEPKRIDREEHNNKIDDEIIAMIRRSRFLVADYTGNRGGVYFEAGFAKGLGIEVIWTCREDELDKIHFDTRQYNFILWKSDNLPEFRERLKNRIEATLSRGRYVKPLA